MPNQNHTMEITENFITLEAVCFKRKKIYTVPAEIIDTLTFSFQKIHNFLQKLFKWKHILVSTDVLIWFAEEHNKKLE